MLPFLQTIIAAIVWAVANVVYIDMRRKGLHGFTRFAAFWAGTPTTWISLFTLQPPAQPRFEAEDDDALLEEIRRDRSKRLPERSDGPDTQR